MINNKGLKQIFESNGCDKAQHGFATTYQLLSYFKEPGRILEIGVLEGASVRSWHEYFTDAYIVGVDINSKRNVVLPEDRCEFIVGDANKIEIPGFYDWIIDDGSHKAIDVKESFLKYWPKLNPKGWYIIEDVHCAFKEYYPDYGGWAEWVFNLIAINLHQLGENEKLNEKDLPQFGLVIQDKSIIAIQKR